MARFVACFLTACFFACPTAIAGDKAKTSNEPQWRVLELDIKKGDPDHPLFISRRDMGTQVTAALHLPMKSIVGVDPSESKLASFTDDKDTDLIQNAKKGRVEPSGLVGGFRITTDCQYCRVAYYALGRPVEGATKVRVKGTLAVLIGKDEKTVEMQDVALPLGIDLKVGKFHVPKLGGNTFLHYDGDRPLKSLVLLDAAGKEVAFKYPGYFEGGPPEFNLRGKQHFRGRFYTKTRIDRCTVRVVYFETVERILVPVDLEASLGL